MTGRPQGTEPRTEVLQVRFTPTGMRTLDELRGSSTRSAYVRRLIAKEYGALRGSTGHRPPPALDAVIEQAVADPAPTQTPGRHLHRRHHKYTDDTYEQGHAVEHWACQCGEPMT